MSFFVDGFLLTMMFTECIMKKIYRKGGMKNDTGTKRPNSFDYIEKVI